MEKNSEQDTQKWLREHLSLSVSMIALTLLLLSQYLPAFWRLVVALLIGSGIVWNHFLCIKLHKTLSRERSV